MQKRILIIMVCAVFAGGFLLSPLTYAGEDTQALKQQINSLQKKVDKLQKALQAKPGYSTPSPEQEWNPFWEMDRMQEEMNKMLKNNFGGVFNHGGFRSFGNGGFYNADVDIHEAQGQYIVKIDLPGMDKANINIETQGDMLVISGERKTETEKNNQAQHYYRKERSFGYFSRSIPLPDDADRSNINADYKNGVLTIKIAKKESAKPKSLWEKIKIN